MILIKNAKTLGKYLGESTELVENVFCIISDGKVTELGTGDKEGDFEKIIDAKGYLLTPGLIDPQVHFREPGLEYKEDIESGSRAANKGGFTTVISMPNTSPTADNAQVVANMWKRSQEVGLCRVYPTGALSFGLKGEEITDFKSLKEAGAIAITDDGKGVQKDEVFLSALKLALENNLPILDHSEDESLSNGGAIHLGEVSKKHGVKGIDSMSEAAHVKRGCAMSGETGAHYHALHVSTKESFQYIREAKAKGWNVTCEVSPHHLLLCDEDIPLKENNELDANFKMNPPLRSKEDRLASVEALLDGTVDAIATDHAPHSPAEKDNHIEKAPFGIIGLETAFPLIYTNFVKTGKMSLTKAIDLMTEQAADLFSLNHLGRLKVGEIADLALFDLDHAVEIDDSYFRSKSKNSPFIGHNLYGNAKMTILEGKIVFQEKDF